MNRLSFLFSTALLFVYIISTYGNSGKVNDIDGNVYKTVIIGDQEWFAENLKTTRYNDGFSITNVTDNMQWEGLSSGAYCWYDNNSDNGDIYSALYNWYAVATGKLCPDGWRVPTDSDWTKLTNYLGGQAIAGAKLKTTGTLKTGEDLWNNPNVEATNEKGFYALPGGYRVSHGFFRTIGHYGLWWSASDTSIKSAWNRGVYSNSGFIYRCNSNKKDGLSIRCIRDIL